jgi:hypothetical protein
MYLAESNQSPFGNLEPLAALKTNPDGAGIVQAIGPLKALAGNDPNSSAPQRFLIVTDLKDSSQWYCGKPAHTKPLREQSETDDFTLLGTSDDLFESASFLQSTSPRPHNVANTGLSRE